jgi:hypothetical protein
MARIIRSIVAAIKVGREGMFIASPVKGEASVLLPAKAVPGNSNGIFTS